MLQIARMMAAANLRPLFFSLEMRANENAARMMAAEAKVNSRIFRTTTRLDDEASNRIMSAYRRLKNGPPAWINDRPDMTPVTLSAIARKYTRKHNIQAVFVDYLQLLKPTNNRDPQYVQIGDASRSMKLLARALQVPLICAAQLNREVEGRGDATPRLSDLRGSGSLEQDADCVMFLHGEERTRNEREECIDLIVAKSRSSSAGYSVKLNWHKPSMTFTEYDDGRYERIIPEE